jgi:peptidoglycan/LPS O-acetylase OafA/YrhL
LSESSDISDYFKKRILRIYPGFLINTLLCLFVLAPLVTNKYFPSLQWLPRLLFLGSPHVDDAFEGMPMPGMNNPIWTLSYEFRCYILVAILGILLGLHNIRSAIAGSAVVLLLLSGLQIVPEYSGALYVALGSPSRMLRLLGMFAAGMTFYLWRDRIVYNHKFALPAFLSLLGVSLLFPVVSNVAIAVSGGYLVFWATFKLPAMSLSRFGNKTDLSYGIYLYAWPIQMSIAYALHRSINPWALSFLALIGSAAAAYLSWTSKLDNG